MWVHVCVCSHVSNMCVCFVVCRPMLQSGVGQPVMPTNPTNPTDQLHHRRRRRRKRSPAQDANKNQNRAGVPQNWRNHMNDTYGILMNDLNITHSFNLTLNGSAGDGEEDRQPYEAATVYFENEIKLTNLRHFQEYNIEVCVRACVCVCVRGCYSLFLFSL